MPSLIAVELEPNRSGEIAAAVAQHDDLVVSAALLAPGVHHKVVVGRKTSDRVDPLGLELGRMRDIARQMALGAGPRIGARKSEQNDLFAAEELVCRHRLDPIRGHIAQGH